MNHNCNGDFFTVRGWRGYCCLLDSAVIAAAALNDGDICPNCDRRVRAQDAGECRTKTTTFVVIPHRGSIPVEVIG